MRRRSIVFLAVVACSLYGCPAKKSEIATNVEQSATDSAAHPASPGGPAIVPSAVSGYTVLVTIDDGHIVVANPDQIPPGPAIFTVTNNGKQVHNLFVEGEGIHRAPDSDNIAPGATVSFDVLLKRGTYTLYCPILDHRQKGETTTLIIKERDTARPATSTAIPGPAKSTS
jgi:hypothetical protein